MTYQEFHASFNIFMFFQANFSCFMAEKIWPNDFDHFYDKYVAYDNFLIFYNCLDVDNKQKVYDYYFTHKSN